MAGEQAGDVYYLSSKNVFNLGVVDNLTGLMNAYVWQEEDAKRGANNIVSCIHKELDDRGVFSNPPKNGELFICADNCAGQNKNEIVLKYLTWLVESKFFKKVQLSFLIKGHTKNNCDRMFNLLKLIYRNKNIYSFRHLTEILNTNEFINVIPLVSTDMFDFKSWLDNRYRNLFTGTISCLASYKAVLIKSFMPASKIIKCLFGPFLIY